MKESRPLDTIDNQYLMENSLIVLNILCGVNSTSLFDILFGIHYLVVSGQISGLISSFLSNRRLRVVLNGKSSQEHPVNAGVSQGSIPGPALLLLHINNLPDDVISDIAI